MVGSSASVILFGVGVGGVDSYYLTNQQYPILGCIVMVLVM